MLATETKENQINSLAIHCEKVAIKIILTEGANAHAIGRFKIDESAKQRQISDDQTTGA